MFCGFAWLNFRDYITRVTFASLTVRRYHALAAAASARDVKDNEEGKIGAAATVKKIQVGRWVVVGSVVDYLPGYLDEHI